MDINVTPTGAVRVWAGVRTPGVAPQDFYHTLGDTFIPGTLYVLRPLGIAAYNVSVLVHDSLDFPNECALIAYRSQAAFRAITRENLQGRLHRPSHSAIFDMQRSRAAFPVRWSGSANDTDTFYL